LRSSLLQHLFFKYHNAGLRASTENVSLLLLV
jgi:hypothetical protein